METPYVLRYCYRYEPGFDVYSLWDLVVYKDTDELSDEVYQYLKKEDEMIDKEDDLQVFYRATHFSYQDNVTSIPFLKLELFPLTRKEDSVLNLVFVPLQKHWNTYSNLEQLMMIDDEIKKAEKEIDMRYELVDYSIEQLELNQLEICEEDVDAPAEELEE